MVTSARRRTRMERCTGKCYYLDPFLLLRPFFILLFPFFFFLVFEPTERAPRSFTRSVSRSEALTAFFSPRDDLSNAATRRIMSLSLYDQGCLLYFFNLLVRDFTLFALYAAAGTLLAIAAACLPGSPNCRIGNCATVIAPSGGPAVPGILPVLLRTNPGGVFAPAKTCLRWVLRCLFAFTIYLVERK